MVGDPVAASIYQEYYSHQEDYHTERFSREEQRLAFVDPNIIEGVHVRGMAPKRTIKSIFSKQSAITFSIESPDVFWGMHGHETHTRYLDLTSHIPTINKMLYGRSEEEQQRIIDQLRNDPVLGACINLCFAPENRIRVWILGDIYEFDGDGRHRILSARENMLKAKKTAIADNKVFDPSLFAMPVLIIGELKKNK